MAPETQARLLEPFFTTKAAAGHAGLGLTSVARTMAQHGGFRYCSSTPGEGTEFRLYFLLAEAAPAPIAAPASTLAPFAGPPRHILICEDEPMVREAASLVLTGAGYRVTAVADGVDGLCRAAEPGAEPDLVLTDFEIPGLHGFELLHSFQAMLARVPLVVMTGRSSAELPRHAHEHGVAAVIEKPFSREQLLIAVAAALAHEPR
jgi:two-component system cell cycle sensor histidine kinase/response regulator CckA